MGRQEEEFLAGQGADGLGTSQLHAEESKEATFVHPEARKLFKKAPCLRYVPLFGEASEGYGPKPVLAIGLSYFLSKGLANRLLNGSLIAMFLNRFGIEGILFQRLANLSNMGWSVKPLTAVTSDIFPFFGYTKRWYMFAACLIGPIFSLIFGLLPAKESSAVIGAVCVFVAGLSKANTDILTQGHYSRMIRRVPTPGPALVSWVWWFIILGGLIGSFVVGPLGDAELPHISPFISSAVQLMVLPFFVLNWFGELPNREERYQDALIFHELDAKKREEARKEAAKAGEGNQQLIHGEPLGQDAVEAEQGNEDDAMKPLVFKEPRDCCCGAFQINEEVFQRNKRETIYSILIALCVIAVALTSMFGSRLALLIVAIVVSLSHCCFNFYALSWVVAKANLFGYLNNASTVSFHGAITPFFLQGPDCVPGGPNFSLFFVQTVGGSLSGVTSVIGILVFNYFFSKRTYRMTYFVTLAMLIMANMFDFIMIMRWNRPYVSDHLIYVLGDLIISPVIAMMNWMPTTILLSRLCPRGSESTVYAILAASSNLGNTMGNVLGNVIMEYALPVKTRPPCDFTNLKWLALIAGFFAPCVQIPLIFTLLPDARMSDELDERGKPVRKAVESVIPPDGRPDEAAPPIVRKE